MDSRWAWLVACALLFAAEARADTEKVRVTVAVAAEGSLRSAIEARLAAQSEVPVEVRVVPLPQGVAPGPARDPAIAEALSQARAHYVAADFEACLARLPEDAAFLALFAQGDSNSVARSLMYRAACQAGRGANEEAQRAAQTLARFGLEVPSDVGAVTPDVERMLTDALRKQRASPRASLRVQSTPANLQVAVDGRKLGCLTPCTAELAPGAHIVVVEGDGSTLRAERITLASAGSTVTVKTTPASPELAAAQWSARYAATSVGLDSAESLKLLAQAVRAPRLVLISTESAGPSLLNLRGAYGQDGNVAARSGAERVPLSDAPDEGVKLLEDLLVRGKTLAPARPIWKSVWFWTSVGVVAAGAATATALLLQEPVQRTQVGF